MAGVTPKAWTAMTTALSVTAATVSFAWAVRDSTVDPPAPPEVCTLLRPALVDQLVPQHGPSRPERLTRAGYRVSNCDWAGPKAQLWVGLARFGRDDGRSPTCVAQKGLLRPLNRTIKEAELGDSSIYFAEVQRDTGHTNVYLSACLATFGVHVEYSAAELAEPALAQAAETVAQEVLSQL